MKNLHRNKKALSPVIATVILVSVTIVVAVAVSYWMGGIAGLYTRFEKVEISSCYAVKGGSPDYNYTVTVSLKNSGSADSSIVYVLVNGKPSEQYLSGTDRQIIVSWTVGTDTGYLPEDSMTIPLGKSGTIILEIEGSLYESGTTLDLKFHSAAGKDYPQMLSLP